VRRTLFTVSLIAGLLAAGSTALAGNGAVKAGLQEVTPGTGERGFVVLNTDDEGFLVVNAHVKAGIPNMEFRAQVWINDELVLDVPAALTTNGTGNGAYYVEVDLPDDAVDAVAVKVRLEAVVEGVPTQYDTPAVPVVVKQAETE